MGLLALFQTYDAHHKCDAKYIAFGHLKRRVVGVVRYSFYIAFLIGGEQPLAHYALRCGCNDMAFVPLYETPLT